MVEAVFYHALELGELLVELVVVFDDLLQLNVLV